MDEPSVESAEHKDIVNLSSDASSDDITFMLQPTVKKRRVEKSIHEELEAMRAYMKL